MKTNSTSKLNKESIFKEWLYLYVVISNIGARNFIS